MVRPKCQKKRDFNVDLRRLFVFGPVQVPRLTVTFTPNSSDLFDGEMLQIRYAASCADQVQLIGVCKRCGVQESDLSFPEGTVLKSLSSREGTFEVSHQARFQTYVVRMAFEK